MKALDCENPIAVKVPRDTDNDLDRQLGTLMEVYVPIVFPGTTIPAGSLEIYQYYGPTAARVSSMRNRVFGGVGVGFSVLYVGLVFSVWGAWKTTNRQHFDLESVNFELETMVNARTAELSAAQDELAPTEKLAAIGQLAGGVAHDRRNSLGAIGANPSLKEFLDIIDHQVNRSSDYITGLMNFANVRVPNLVETK